MTKRKHITVHDVLKKAGPHYACAKTSVYSAFEDELRGGAKRRCLGVYSTSKQAWDKIERRKQKLGEVKSNSKYYNVVVYGLDQDVWGT